MASDNVPNPQSINEDAGETKDPVFPIGIDDPLVYEAFHPAGPDDANKPLSSIRAAGQVIEDAVQGAVNTAVDEAKNHPGRFALEAGGAIALGVAATASSPIIAGGAALVGAGEATVAGAAAVGTAVEGLASITLGVGTIKGGVAAVNDTKEGLDKSQKDIEVVTHPEKHTPEEIVQANKNIEANLGPGALEAILTTGGAAVAGGNAVRLLGKVSIVDNAAKGLPHVEPPPEIIVPPRSTEPILPPATVPNPAETGSPPEVQRALKVEAPAKPTPAKAEGEPTVAMSSSRDIAVRDGEGRITSIDGVDHIQLEYHNGKPAAISIVSRTRRLSSKEPRTDDDYMRLADEAMESPSDTAGIPGIGGEFLRPTSIRHFEFSPDTDTWTLTGKGSTPSTKVEGVKVGEHGIEIFYKGKKETYGSDGSYTFERSDGHKYTIQHFNDARSTYVSAWRSTAGLEARVNREMIPSLLDRQGKGLFTTEVRLSNGEVYKLDPRNDPHRETRPFKESYASWTQSRPGESEGKFEGFIDFEPANFHGGPGSQLDLKFSKPIRIDPDRLDEPGYIGESSYSMHTGDGLTIQELSDSEGMEKTVSKNGKPISTEIGGSGPYRVYGYNDAGDRTLELVRFFDTRGRNIQAEKKDESWRITEMIPTPSGEPGPSSSYYAKDVQISGDSITVHVNDSETRTYEINKDDFDDPPFPF